jgi:PleD family two-component response regulator
VRVYDIVGRYGGEEFIIALPNTSIKGALILAQKLQKSISQLEFKHRTNTFGITCSFGVTSLYESKEELSEKINNDIETIFNVKNTLKVDWTLIETTKKNVLQYMLELADKSLYEAKNTTCLQCNFSSDKEIDFKNNKCPKCGHKIFDKGRNRIVVRYSKKI